MFIEELAAEHRRDLQNSADRWRLGRPARRARATPTNRHKRGWFRRRMTASVATAEQS
jgi:hypothetical protein